MKRILLLLVMGITFAGCSSIQETGNKDQVRLTGEIQKAGMSTFQYGTHILKSDDKTYALKSSKIDLDLYSAKQVSLKGLKVDGYPIESGPDFIEVTEVTLK